MRSDIIFEDATEIFSACMQQQLQCQIAGGLRRSEPSVEDIRFVCILRQSRTQFIQAARTVMQATPSFKSGSNVFHMARQTNKAGIIPVNIYLTNENDWGRVVALATGPDSYVNGVLSRAWQEKGYQETESGLLPQSILVPKGKKWVLQPNINPDLHRVSFPTEEAFFDWLGIEYVEPQKRGKW